MENLETFGEYCSRFGKISVELCRKEKRAFIVRQKVDEGAERLLESILDNYQPRKPKDICMICGYDGYGTRERTLWYVRPIAGMPIFGDELPEIALAIKWLEKNA